MDELRQSGVKLREVAEFKYGKSLSEPNRIPGPFPVVGSGGVAGYHKEALVNGGIVVGRKGSIGTVQWFDEPFFPIDTVYFIDEINPDYDLKFFYYFLQSFGLDNYNSDAAVPGLSRALVYNLRAKFPDSKTQKEIAEILSTYDRLIENNTKRIAILEQMAEQIYKEWFVRMRFPDYENTKFIKGIPEGWEVKVLGDLSTVTSSRRVFAHDYVESGIPFYRSKEIIERANYSPISEPLFISEEKFRSIENKNGVPREGDILITSVGTLGKLYQVVEGDKFYFKDGNLIWFKSSNEVVQKYIYHFLKSDSGQGRLLETTIGSSQPAFTIENLKKIKLLNPSQDLLLKFFEQIDPIDKSLGKLGFQCAKLREMKNFLLPRLISGKLSVKQAETKLQELV